MIQTGQEPLLKERKSSPLRRSTLSIYSCCAAATFIVCIFVFYYPSNSNEDTSAIANPVSKYATKTEDDSSDSSARVLYTDNPNDYLCDPDFLYHDVNENPLLYQFSCMDIDGTLSCDTGYALKCVVSATYGNTAGACGEIDAAPNGCGFTYEEAPVACSDDVQCVGSHLGEVDECFNLDTNEPVSTTNPCTDCVPICGCGASSPQFYNVADCFGDLTSSACVDELADGESTAPNLYLPQSLWENYCYGKTVCTLELKNKYAQCYHDEDEEIHSFYTSVTVNDEETAEFVGNGYSTVDVLDYFNEIRDCEAMDFKILAVCEKVTKTKSF